jgi:3D (Asp-Asp-Asp) domain-containing protein
LTVSRELIVSVSAYSSTPDQTDSSPFITANGAFVYDGLVAANFLPLGTKIKIPQYFGDKVFTVEDRMNKRYWQKIDVWFPDRESALQFGVRHLKVQILES